MDNMGSKIQHEKRFEYNVNQDPLVNFRMRFVGILHPISHFVEISGITDPIVGSRHITGQRISDKLIPTDRATSARALRRGRPHTQTRGAAAALTQTPINRTQRQSGWGRPNTWSNQPTVADNWPCSWAKWLRIKNGSNPETECSGGRSVRVSILLCSCNKGK